MNKQDALETMQSWLKDQTVALGWAEPPISFEDLIRARLGDEIVDEVYKAIEVVYDE